MLKPKEYYKDKKVIVRVDYNVPVKDGIIEESPNVRSSWYQQLTQDFYIR